MLKSYKPIKGVIELRILTGKDGQHWAIVVTKEKRKKMRRRKKNLQLENDK